MQDRRQDLYDLANELGIKVINATRKSDQNRIAIHLLNPDLDSFEDALSTAQKDNFDTIVVHSNKTWPRKKTGE